ncbi:MAG: Essential protein Yae1, N terminal [Trizodia sp. TS-e1964]|nr:MAG: Essential protein Yae1, N terminal [Trizodia sp. TS-e1964]
MDEIFTATSDTADEPSDMPRLRSVHCTAGYREGISSSKQQQLQEGFDEGYSLGAELGARIGFILGALEGLAIAAIGGSRQEGRLRTILTQARAELTTVNVFNSDLFKEDGTWKFAVGVEDEEGGLDGNGETSITFKRVADMHPLVLKWSATLQLESQKLAIRLDPPVDN